MGLGEVMQDYIYIYIYTWTSGLGDGMEGFQEFAVLLKRSLIGCVYIYIYYYR